MELKYIEINDKFEKMNKNLVKLVEISRQLEKFSLAQEKNQKIDVSAIEQEVKELTATEKTRWTDCNKSHTLLEEKLKTGLQKHSSSLKSIKRSLSDQVSQLSKAFSELMIQNKTDFESVTQNIVSGLETAEKEVNRIKEIMLPKDFFHRFEQKNNQIMSELQQEISEIIQTQNQFQEILKSQGETEVSATQDKVIGSKVEKIYQVDLKAG